MRIITNENFLKFLFDRDVVELVVNKKNSDEGFYRFTVIKMAHSFYIYSNYYKKNRKILIQ